MSDVVLKNVSKVYAGGNAVVRNINIEIADRDFVVLVGPSGCGKSTTLRMIAGLEEISDGDLYIDSKKVNDLPPKDRDIAMVFQNYALYPHLTVKENIAFGLKLRNFDKKEIENRVSEAAHILGLDSLLDRKPKALSGGQRQRVALGRALVRRPKVFLFDEPLSNLDAKLRVQMRTEITKLHRDLNATMIYVTHDQVEAMTMGTKIVVMKDGIIQQTDSPLKLYNSPINKFVAGFIGSPSMNFIEGILQIEKDKSVFSSHDTILNLPKIDCDNTLVEIKVWLGIRPEHLSLQEDTRNSSICSIKGIITGIEQMGNETFVYIQYSGASIICRVPPSDKLILQSEISLFFDAANCYLFDYISEDRIG